MEKLRIQIVHCNYNLKGGEDVVVENEYELLKKTYNVKLLKFKNKSGLIGFVQLFLSLLNIFALIRVTWCAFLFKPNIIWVHNWHFSAGPIVFWVAKLSNVKLYHTVHNFRILCPSATLLNGSDLFLNSLNEKFPWTAIKNKLYRNSTLLTFWLAFIVWFHKKIGTWNNIDKFVFLTEFSKRIFLDSKLDFLENSVFVKPNFVPDNFFVENLKANKNFVFVGRLSNEKGIVTLLDAFKINGFNIKIVGNGSLESLVKFYSAQYPNIKYLGIKNKEAVLNEIEASDALIFPSIWYEGMPMTILEAFSCGTPVVASKIGSMIELINDGITGYHFNSGDIYSLNLVLNRFNSLSVEEFQLMRRNVYQEYILKYSQKAQSDYLDLLLSSEKYE